MADNAKLLSWDSIIDLTISNLVLNSQKEPVKVTLRRCEAVEREGQLNLVIPDEEPSDSKVLPSRLFELELSIVDKLDGGASGTAFSTSLESLWECTDEDSLPIKLPGLPHLPPLVLKVAYESTFSRLAREAFNYRVLKALQGVAFPRYYGWYNLTLEDGLTYPGANFINDRNTTRTVSVLLMERMGEHLDLKETDEEVDDIVDMLHDLSRWNVEHHDLRRANLLRAPSSPPGLPGDICELHGRQHKFRLIDLESVNPRRDNIRSRAMIGIELFNQLRDMYYPRDILR